MTIARRAAGIALGASPFAVVFLSLASATRAAPSPRLAIGMAGVALAIALLNLWLTLGRSMYLGWRYPDREIRRISGYPLIGNVIAVMALIVGFGTVGTSLLALLAIVVDFGGLPWFVIFTWRDPGLWDPR